MTFILNALHKDFSLIASDRKGTTNDPVTLKMNGTTINIVPRGTLTIEGIQKIHLSKIGDIAIGYAGNTADHNYKDRINTIGSISSALHLIRNHMEEFLSHDHRHILKTNSFMNNQGIATYYESETGTYFSNFYEFSPIHNCTRLYSGNEGRLIHVGSGSRVFESAVGLEEINRFIESLQSSDDIPSYVEWMREAYKKVTAMDEGSGEEMVLFVGTKQNPCFVEFSQTD